MEEYLGTAYDENTPTPYCFADICITDFCILEFIFG